jgi:hypothetical protein
MRYLELLEDVEPDAENAAEPAPQKPQASSKVYFHVTTRHRLKSIERNGIEPNHKRRWKTGFGRQLGERGNVYLMSDFTAAVRWAFKMQWEHYNGKPPTPSPYVIICVRENPKNLAPDPHPENGLYGNSWFQKNGSIDPQDIMKIIPLTPELIKQVIDGGKAVAEGLRGMTSLYSAAKCIRMLTQRGWHATSTPDMYQNDDYPEYSIDLNIHSVDPQGPFTVYKGRHKVAVTSAPPTPQQLGIKDHLI